MKNIPYSCVVIIVELRLLSSLASDVDEIKCSNQVLLSWGGTIATSVELEEPKREKIGICMVLRSLTWRR
jgi:hypothetical protein